MHQIKWAFSFLGKSKYILFLAWILTMAFNLLTTFDARIISQIVDDVLYPMFDNPDITTAEVMDQLLPLALTAYGIIVLRLLMRFSANLMREHASQHVTFELRKSLFKKLGEQSRHFFMTNRSGDLINKCTGDVDAINHFIGWVSFAIFDSVVMLVIVLGVFFSISWKFTLIQLCLAPISFIVASKLGKSVRPLFVQARLQLSKLNTVVNENISGNRVVRAFCREKHEIEKFDVENEKYYDLNLKANKAWITYSPIMETVGNVMNACSIIIGAILVVLGDITVGDLTIFTGLSWMLNSPMQQLGFLINDTQRFLVSCERVRELYESTPEIVSPEKPAHTGEINGDIDLDHVSLTFDGNTVLKVSLVVSQYHIAIGCQRSRIETRYEDRLGLIVGVGDNAVRTLDDQRPQACFEQQFGRILLRGLLDCGDVELLEALGCVGLNGYVENLALLTAINGGNRTAYGRGEQNAAVILREEERVACLNLLADLNQKLGNNTFKIQRRNCVRIRHRESGYFRFSFTQKVDVETLVNFDDFRHFG